MFDLIERSARFVCLPYGSYVVGIAIRQCKFFSVPDKPFAELFIFPEFFEQGYVFRIRAQARIRTSAALAAVSAGYKSQQVLAV